MWAFPNAAAFKGAAVFASVFDRIVPPWAHFVSCLAEGMSLFIESDVIRCIFRRFSPAVDVDEGIYAPVFQQCVSGDVVMCGIKADIFCRKPKAVASKIVYGIEEIFTVVSSGISKFQEDGKIDFKPAVPGTEQVQGVPEIPGFVVAVPSPSGIWVGIMPAAGTAVWAGKAAGSEMFAIR